MNRYGTMSRDLLGKARQALAEGDLIQASEKGWGAAAQAVKAVAEHRGWPLSSHGALFTVVNRLVAETGDRRIGELFSAGNALHQNFHEHWMPPESVKGNLDSIDELVARLEPLAQ